MYPRSAVALAPRSADLEADDLQALADDQLLARFYEYHEEAAFAVLVERHSLLVFRVCRRILGNPNDAEDAFQATFLVLVSKGASLRQPGHLASWLYGVANRTARKFKAKAALRSKRESQASEISTRMGQHDKTYHELTSILDEELSELPQKYSLPLVLCYLEGKTNAQAAAQLGWPEGSMSRRLSRARDLLRSRLTRRGLALSAALIAAACARSAAPCVPENLVEATIEAGRRAGPCEAAKSIFSRAVVATLAVAALVVAVAIVGWQLGPPAFAANLFHHGGPSNATSLMCGTANTQSPCAGACAAP